jgi:hypothetical protein
VLAGAVVGLCVYVLAIYAAVPRPGWGSAGERAPGLVFARYRQAQFDAAADDRPLPRPSMVALPWVRVPVALVPDLAGSAREDDRSAVTSLSASPGCSRSPPIV